YRFWNQIIKMQQRSGFYYHQFFRSFKVQMQHERSTELLRKYRVRIDKTFKPCKCIFYIFRNGFNSYLVCYEEQKTIKFIINRNVL
ncbi:hypothetical protein L9F63_000102, partial [Diploptera punctata]